MSGTLDLDTAAAAAAVADLALKGTLVLAVAAGATLALRRASASARHLVWTLGFAGLLALPVLGVALPRWRIPILPARPERASTAAPRAQPAVRPGVLQTDEAVLRTRVPGAPAADLSTPPPAVPMDEEGNGRREALGVLALLAWVLGAAGAMLRLAASVHRVRRDGRAARPLAHGPAAEMRDRLVWRLAIDRPVALLEGPAGCMPLTWGVARPRVLLPAGTAAWPADRLEAVLTHELAHVRRRDCGWQLVAEAACALHWFNPLAWAAARRMRLESEHACDDQVLLTGSRGADYAGHLLDVARTLRPPRAAVLAAVPMARPSQLRTRLLAVLSAERARGPVPLRWAAPALVSGGALLALIAALTPARAGAAEAFAVSPAPCFVPVPGSTFDEESDDAGGRSLWWRTGSCSGEARIEGEVRFTDDFTAVRSVRPGGVFRLALRDGARSTEVTIRPGAGGGIHPSLRTDGRAQAWGPGAERWLADALPRLMRLSSYGADHRAVALLAQRGADAVAAELQASPSQALRAEYADALLATDADALRRALEQVAALENAAVIPDLLQRAAPRLPADAQVHAAYLRAAGRVEPATELRRVLVALAATGRLREAGWRELFRQARRIGSGTELELLLGSVAPRVPADGGAQAAYLATAGQIADAADRRRALVALVGGGRLDAAAQVRVLGQAAGLGADAEKELLLMQAAPHLSPGPRVARAYRAAAGSIADAAVRGRALAAYGQLPRPAAADTVPVDDLDDTGATTILSLRDAHAAGRGEYILLAKDVTLTADRGSIERISADGWVIYREHAGAATRRVRITPGGDGRLRYEWSGDFTGVDRASWMRRTFTHFADSTRPRRRW